MTDLFDDHRVILFGDVVREVADTANDRPATPSDTMAAALMELDLPFLFPILRSSGYTPAICPFSSSPQVHKSYTNRWCRGDQFIALHVCVLMSPRVYAMRQPITSHMIFLDRGHLTDLYPHLTVARNFAFNNLQDNGDSNVFIAALCKWQAMLWIWIGHDDEICRYEHTRPFNIQLTLSSNAKLTARQPL